ncbi:MAG: hypothetical protein FJ264_03375 [Planctomycetes bacterium]|nr:hypothetical protein [Planctomycetota bacterium]
MAAILKENILQKKKKPSVSKDKVNKIVDVILEKPKAETAAKEIVKKEQSQPLKSSSVKKYIFSDEILISDENISDLDELRSMLCRELKPSTEIESFFVDRIVSSIWRLKRCMKIERQIIEHASSSIQEYEQGFFTSKKRTKEELQQLRALKVIEEKDKFDEIIKYESSLERQFYLALRELRMARQQEAKQKKVR